MNNLIAIPCYNCEDQIIRVLGKLNSLGHKKFKKIILIDNGSQDKTIEVALNTIKDSHGLVNIAEVYKNQENYGLGGTHKVIFDFAIKQNFDSVTILHGDDQANIDDINILLGKAELQQMTILGSRFSPGSELNNYQRMRIFGNKVLNFIFSLVTKNEIKDLGSGLNVFYVNDIKRVNLNHISDTFNFNCELLLEMINKKIKFSFYPITWSELDQVSNAKNVEVALSMLKSLMMWKVGKKRNIKRKYISELQKG